MNIGIKLWVGWIWAAWGALFKMEESGPGWS
jgi:hypothetical protein